MICDETKEANARGEQNGQTLVAHAAWMETISHDIAALVSGQQDNELLSFNQKSLQMNIKILDAVAQMQQLLRSLPPQIEREQPVIFEDAHGRITPVHVEFVNSFEAFQAVLLTRFQHMPGLRKVRNLEYSMQDARSQEILDLSKPWKSNFRPGRRLNMSMVFRMLSEVISTCPSCSAENPNLLGHGDADFQWYVGVALPQEKRYMSTVLTESSTIVIILNAVYCIAVSKKTIHDYPQESYQISHAAQKM